MLPAVISMKIDVVITHYNDIEGLKICIDSIKTNVSHDINIIIADAGSGDKEWEFIRELKYVYMGLPNSNTTFSVTCNNALKVSKSDSKYFIILNCDTIISYNFVNKLVGLMESNEKIAMCGTFSNFNTSVESPTIGGRLLSPYMDRKHILPHIEELYEYMKKFNIQDSYFVKQGLIPAFACIYRKDCFNEVNGFDEGYVNGFEDYDLCMKLKHAGYLIGIDSGCYIFHFGSISKTFKSLDENHKRFLDKWELSFRGIK